MGVGGIGVMALPFLILAMLPAMVAGHFLSRWLDRRFGNAASFSRRFSFRRAKTA